MKKLPILNKNLTHIMKWKEKQPTNKMLSILNPILEFVNFLKTTLHYVLVVSFLIGKGIFAFIEQIFNFIVFIFQGIVVVLEELWLFIRELHFIINDTFTYIETSTNRGVTVVIEGLTVFGSELGRFLTNSKLHSKLLASAFGQWMTNFVGIICGGLLLIGDSVCFVVTIIPKSLFNIVIWIGDLVAFGIGGTWKLLLRLAQNVIDEIFRYTIALAVIFLAVKNRRRIYWTARRWTIQIIRFSINWITKIYRFLFVLQPPRPVPETLLIRQRSPLTKTSPTSILNKSNETNCCVVCRDRPKCVLLLPCKHLCMCEECAEFIGAMRQAFCPLCRSTVNKQLSVYVWSEFESVFKQAAKTRRGFLFLSGF